MHRVVFAGVGCRLVPVVRLRLSAVGGFDCCGSTTLNLEFPP